MKILHFLSAVGAAWFVWFGVSFAEVVVKNLNEPIYSGLNLFTLIF